MGNRGQHYDKTQRLQRAIFNLLQQHEQDDTLPTSARFLYYELEGTSDEYGVLVSKKKKGARRTDQDLIAALTVLRETEKIPWNWIVDETRHITDGTCSRTVKESLEQSLKYASIDPWQHGTVRPFVICESRSLSGVLSATCSQYGVNITATSGQCAGFLRTKLAKVLNAQPQGQRLSILYCGDLDPQGTDIEYNTRGVLRDCVTHQESFQYTRPSGAFDWERLMLTEEQVAEYNLPSVSKSDKRKNHGAPYEAWECESLSQKLIVTLVENRLKGMLLPTTLESIEAEADKQRGCIKL
jgi:hypothetical protein